MSRRALLSIAIASILASGACSADMVVVRVGRLVDVENSKVLADQAVTIVDGRITKVEAWGQSRLSMKPKVASDPRARRR